VWISGGHITDDAIVEGDAVVRSGARLGGTDHVSDGVHAGIDVPSIPDREFDRALDDLADDSDIDLDELLTSWD
jgi:hypothetical protein